MNEWTFPPVFSLVCLQIILYTMKHKLSPSGISSFHNILTDRPSLPSRQYSLEKPWKALSTPTGQPATASVPQHRAPPSHLLWGQHLIHLHFSELFKGRCWVSPDPVSTVTSLVPDTWHMFVEWMDSWRRQLLQKELENDWRQHAFYQSYSLIRLSIFSTIWPWNSHTYFNMESDNIK